MVWPRLAGYYAKMNSMTTDLRVILDETGTPQGLADAVAKVTGDPTVKGLLILSCSANGFEPAAIDPILKAISVPIAGGVFPAIIYRQQYYETGTLVWGIHRDFDIQIIEGLSQSETAFQAALDEQFTDTLDHALMYLVLVDGFARRIGEFVSDLHDVVGIGTQVMGGGAGTLDMVQRPCLLTNRGMLVDAAIIAGFPVTASIGIGHGWETVSGPYRVTESSQNTIKSLDWRPAAEVYREAIEAHSQAVFGAENFFDVAKAYPFGIARLDAERIVRDPVLMGDDGSLTCVGEVTEGDHIDILHGHETGLIAAARAASTEADKGLQQSIDMRVFIDCISRVLFLEKAFEQEIIAVNADNKPLIGMCSIGEIANHGDEFLEFYNKTSVVAALHLGER